MKRYYSILLPIHTQLEQIVYYSEFEVSIGSRVIVNFNRKSMTGICSSEVSSAALDSKIAYKSISEILDDSGFVPEELLALAAWMARYYRCSAGKAIFAMLPSVIMPEIATQVRWAALPEHLIAPDFVPLQTVLADAMFHNVKDIKAACKTQAFYKTLEQAEGQGLITVKRGFDDKVKPKTVNYLHIMHPTELPSLTVKQATAWEIICSFKAEFPLSAVTDTISYALIKALVAKGMLRIQARQEEHRAMIFPDYTEPKKIILTSAQQEIISSIISSADRPRVHLVYGITGSGKTEVYIEVIKHHLVQGSNALMLIPEIALTPQMVDRFYGAFGEGIAILHSQLTERQRFEQWQNIKNGKCRIVIGARSAVFAPLERIGCIIVDEEHEQSYKQENNPRYNGRDVAIVRGRMQNATVILGTATPSLESWNNALQGRFELHTLDSRPTPQGLPEVHLIDMLEEQNPDLLSETLRECITECLEKHEQIILMQNRRGFASFVQCMKCGDLQQCPQCEISLYYHHDKEELLCHYCGYHLPIPRKCPACSSYTFSYGAPGTQKIEQLLQTYFPTARILRLDSDSSQRKNTYNNMYEKMRKHEIDILLGTQMISKGLDFPGVTLVGVILADISLNVPDFRAAERTFNLLTQVAGRSGRGDKAGKVIIQTWNPSHYAIAHAVKHDFQSFAAEEMSYRQRLFYPPFARLARFIFSSEDAAKLRAALDKCYAAIDKIRSHYAATELIILGPTPAPLSKLNNLYRYHLILKAKDAATLSTVLEELEQLFKFPSAISVAIDVDPLSLM